MRSIPIEVSAEIWGIRRQKTRNGLPHLLPILDSSQPSKDVTEVKVQAAVLKHKVRWSRKQLTIIFTVELNMYKALLLDVVTGELFKRGMWK